MSLTGALKYLQNKTIPKLIIPDGEDAECTLIHKYIKHLVSALHVVSPELGLWRDLEIIPTQTVFPKTLLYIIPVKT